MLQKVINNFWITSQSPKERESIVDQVTVTKKLLTARKYKKNKTLMHKRTLSKVVENHIDKNGTKNFKNSSLVITERNSRFTTPLRSGMVTREPVFDINMSNKILMERKKVETIKILGQTVHIQDSDDEDPHLVQTLLKETGNKKKK